MKNLMKYGILFLSTAFSLMAMEKLPSLEELRSEVEELQTMRGELYRGVGANKPENVKLIVNASLGYTKDVEELLDAGARIDAHLTDVNPNREHDTALIGAARAGKADVVRLLIKREANVHASNGRGLTALMEAESAGYKEIVDFLLASGARDSKSQKELNNRLLEACTQGNPEEVASLIRRGAAPNARSEHDWKLGLLPGSDVPHGGQSTPLIRTAQFGHFTHPESVQNEIVRLLLSKGALVNAVNLDGCTALIEAAAKARGEMVKMLLAAGAEVNTLDDEKRSALSYALQDGCTEIVRDLLQHGACRNACLMRGMSPIVYAAKKGREELVRILVEHNEPFRDGELEAASRAAAINAGNLQLAEYLRKDHSLRKG